MTASVRGTRARCSERDERVEDQRDDRRDDEQQQHGPGGVRERVERQHGERQHDELHPARDDDRRARGGAGGGPGAGRGRDVVYVVGHPPASQYARA